MVKLHVIYCYIISVMWYWSYMNLLDLARFVKLVNSWSIPPGITAVSAARSSRDSARRPLWIVVIHLWSRCWTMVDSFILNGEKHGKNAKNHGDSWWFIRFFMGKTWEKPWTFPSTLGDSWWFKNLRRRSFVQHRQVMGKQSKDKDSEVSRTENGFNMLQRWEILWRSCYHKRLQSLFCFGHHKRFSFFLRWRLKCLQVGLFTWWVKMRVWNLHPSERFCPLGFAENGEPPIP